MERLILSVIVTLGIALATFSLLSFMDWQHAALLAAMVGLTGYPFVHGYLDGGRLDVFEPVYLFVILYAFFYISRPAYLLTKKETMSLLGFYLDPQTVSLALGTCAIGLVAFLIGYYWGRNRVVKAGFIHIAEIDPARAKTFAYVLIGVGLLAYIYVIFVLGEGWENTFNTERTARYYISAKNPYVANLTALVGVGLMILCFFALLEREARTKWVLLLTLVCVYGVVDIAYSGSRRFLVNIIFAVLLQRHYLRRRLSVQRVIPLLLVLVIFSASWLYVRSTMHEGTDAVRDRLALVRTEWVLDDINTQGDNVIFDYLVAISNTVPAVYDYGYGTGLLRFFYFPVPRNLWPDKPENVNRIMTQRYDPAAYLNGASAGTSMVGEWYMEFGWWGVAPGALLLGWLLGFSYRWLLANLSTRLAVLVFSCGIFTFVAAIVRGGMFGAATELAQLTLPILFLAAWARARRPAHRLWTLNWPAQPANR